MAQSKAHLHFTASKNGPYHTVEVECKVTEVPRYNASASGYGSRIPTRYLVRWEGRWRRVYVACWSNAGTAYIGPRKGDWIATVSL